MDAGDEVIRRRLREIGPISNWRNVFLFAAGKCFVERQHLRDTIHTICAEMNEDHDDALRKTLAGSRLALDLLEDGPARRQPKYAQSLARLALRLLDLPPAEYHLRLANLYEPNLESVYTQEIEKRLGPNELAKTLGSWSCLMALVESKLPWAISLAEANWPKNSSAQLNLVMLTQQSADAWPR